MDISRESRLLLIVGLGGALAGVVFGYLVWGNVPVVGVASAPGDGRKGDAVVAEASEAARDRAPLPVEEKERRVREKGRWIS